MIAELSDITKLDVDAKALFFHALARESMVIHI